MTSANVTNIPVQPVASTVNMALKASEGSQQDFRMVMSQSVGNDVKNTSSQTTTDAKDMDTQSYQANQTKTEIKTKEPVDKTDEKTVKQVEDAVEDFSEDVKDVLEEQLNVSDEEIENAMETLGFTFVDLTNPTNMTQLIAQLTGCENTVELLMNDNFSNVLDSVAQLTADMLKQTQMTVEDVHFVINEMSQNPSVENGSMAEVMPETSIPQATSENALENVALDSMKMEPVTQQEQNAQAVQVASEEGQVMVEVKGDVSKTETEEVTQLNTDNVDENNQQMTVTADTSDTSKGHEHHETMSDKNSNMQGNNEQVGLNAATADVKAFEAVANQTTQQTSYVTDAKALMEQVVQAAKVSISQNSTTMEMMLNPESLGKLYLQISEKEGNVTAHLYTQNEVAKEALESQMVQLKENMNQQGVKVDSIEVSVGTHEFEKNLEDQAQREKQQGEEIEKNTSKRSRNIDLNNLDELQGLMTEEEELVAKIMRDNGNTVNYTA